MANLDIDSRGWKQLGFKEKSQYIMAYSFGIASILIGFISFIWLQYVPSSVIAMSGLWASVAMAILGISMFFKNKMIEFQTSVNERLNKIDEIEKKIYQDEEK